MYRWMLCILALIPVLLYSADLVIKSDPSDCDVYVVNADTGKKNLVGKTPYTGDLSKIKSNAGGKQLMMQITVHKPGFIPFNVAISLLGGSDIHLNATLEVQKDIEFAQDYDLLVADLFDVLRIVRLKDYSSALRKLNMLENKFPHYSIIAEMQGMIFYLQKEFSKALNYYKKAYGVNPKNMEAYRMKTYLEKRFRIGD